MPTCTSALNNADPTGDTVVESEDNHNTKTDQPPQHTAIFKEAVSNSLLSTCLP